MRKIAARSVPHFLTEAQIEERLVSANEQLQRYEEEGGRILNCIVAIDETLIRSYEPELKSQSAEWDTPVSARPAKFCRKQANIKQLAIFAYDHHGIL